MKLVNQTQQPVFYSISSPTGGQQVGEIEADRSVDHPEFDNQKDVYVAFTPVPGTPAFSIICDETKTGEEVQMALMVEGGIEA